MSAIFILKKEPPKNTNFQFFKGPFVQKMKLSIKDFFSKFGQIC